MPNPDVITNKYHGCVVRQVLTGDGWDVSLFRELTNGGEEFLRKCKDLPEAIAEAKKQGVVLPPIGHPQDGLSAEAEVAPGITAEVEVEK